MVPVRRPSATQFHRASLTEREALVFEAGVKLGGVFHQYLGIPVTSRTSASLARSIERAIGLQPFVVSVHVRIDPKRGPPVGRGRFAYRYLTAEMLHVRVALQDGPIEVLAELRHRPELRYSLMSVTSVRDRKARHPRSARGL
ncbi:MAG: dihydroneopterin aldolase family protein [Thermoplasmata archaeon]